MTQIETHNLNTNSFFELKKAILFANKHFYWRLGLLVDAIVKGHLILYIKEAVEKTISVCTTESEVFEECKEIDLEKLKREFNYLQRIYEGEALRLARIWYSELKNVHE
jgi:hypothetical protein